MINLNILNPTGLCVSEARWGFYQGKRIATPSCGMARNDGVVGGVCVGNGLDRSEKRREQAPALRRCSNFNLRKIVGRDDLGAPQKPLLWSISGIAPQYAAEALPGICLSVALKTGVGSKGGAVRRAPPLGCSFAYFSCTNKKSMAPVGNKYHFAVNGCDYTPCTARRTGVRSSLLGA